LSIVYYIYKKKNKTEEGKMFYIEYEENDTNKQMGGFNTISEAEQYAEENGIKDYRIVCNA
jgi:hypothetical protein